MEEVIANVTEGVLYIKNSPGAQRKALLCFCVPKVLAFFVDLIWPDACMHIHGCESEVPGRIKA